MSRLALNLAGLSRLGWTAGIVIGASLPHWMSLPPWMPLLLIVCVAWRFGARVLRWPLPGRRSMWIATVCSFAAVLLQFQTINGLLPGTALLLVMVSLKFLEAKSQRDQMFLIVIAYFLVFTSVLAGGGLFKGLYLLAFVWITTLGLLQVGRRGPLLSSLPSARLAGRLLAQSVPLMLALFFLFPRLPGPLWGMPGDTSSGASGLSGSMSPGDLTNLGLSDEIAFRAEFTGETPAASEMYWRGPVLSKFDGRTWNQIEGMRGSVFESIEFLGATVEYRVTLEPGARDWAFALEMPERWTTDGRREFIRMSSDYLLTFFTPGNGAARFSYAVTSHSRYRAREQLSASEIERFTRLPEGANPRTRALVATWLEDSPDPGTIIARGLDVFRQSEFAYTLTPPALGEHTADDFIFETREGFCEHYASAFAIMMRMAGLPTRVVTGYQGGELNSIGEYYIIRQSDAHAWTEVWTPQDGWIRVDPIAAVAPERIAVGSTRLSSQAISPMTRIGRMPWFRQAALAWDAVNTFWNDWVVGYGPRLQRYLLESLGFDRPRWRELMIMTVLATALLMLGLTAYLGFKLHRDAARDPAAKLFRQFGRKLLRLEVAPFGTGETPSAFARRAAAALPAYAATIESITSAYLAARYEPDHDSRALAELESRVRRFRPMHVPGSR